MLMLSCLCGSVHISVDQPPKYINDCNCTLCRKSGARWGYFHPSEVTIDGATTGYRRDDKSEPTAEVRFCATCGSTTHFHLTESAVEQFGNTLTGVNMWLADQGDLIGIELRFPDGQAWSGVGDFSYVAEAQVIGRGSASE